MLHGARRLKRRTDGSEAGPGWAHTLWMNVYGAFVNFVFFSVLCYTKRGVHA